MFWGFSEAIDFYEQYKNHVKSDDEKAPFTLNVLLFGSGDPRHIIKTMAKCYRHECKINFYVIEGCPALIARQILLTSIVLEPPSLITRLSKTHLFMVNLKYSFLYFLVFSNFFEKSFLKFSTFVIGYLR